MRAGLPERRILRQVELAAPRDEVWRAITTPARLAAWLGGEVRLDPRPRGRVRWHPDGGQVMVGEVIAADPPFRLVFVWGPDGPARPGEPCRLPARVEMTLERLDGAATRLTVIESVLEPAPWTAWGGR